MATVGFYHRKKRPKKKHKRLSAFGKDEQGVVKTLAVFLQLAESLDRSHASLVRQARLHDHTKKKALLKILADKDCQLEVWGLRNQKKAFKKTFGRKLKIEVKVEEEEEELS